MFSSASFGMGASQGFGMGDMGATQFSMGATQFEASGAEAGAKKPRQEVKETCLPVTIRAVEVALEQRGETGADLKFYGVAEPAIVILVAAVESIVRQAASLEMVLNDATGRIKARYFVTDNQSQELERIVPGCYVSCFGEVRASPVQHLALKGVRLADSANDVSYHVIEAAHAMLKLQRGQAKAEPATPAKKMPEERVDAAAPPIAEFTPEKPLASAAVATPAPDVVMAAPAAVPAPAKAPTGAELRAAVLRLLREADVGPEGLHVDTIAQKIGSATSEVKSVVAELVDDGELYNTITDEHFAAV